MSGRELYELMQDYMPSIFWTEWEKTVPELREAFARLATDLGGRGLR